MGFCLRPSIELRALIRRGDFNISLFAYFYQRRPEDPETELREERGLGGYVASSWALDVFICYFLDPNFGTLFVHLGLRGCELKSVICTFLWPQCCTPAASKCSKAGAGELGEARAGSWKISVANSRCQCWEPSASLWGQETVRPKLDRGLFLYLAPGPPSEHHGGPSGTLGHLASAGKFCRGCPWCRYPPGGCGFRGARSPGGEPLGDAPCSPGNPEGLGVLTGPVST